MSLPECSEFHGNTIFRSTEPAFAQYEKLLYMPLKNQNPGIYRFWGLYDAQGQLAPEAGRFRGPDGVNIGPALLTDQNFQETPQDLSFTEYFYMGSFTPHYGHFLIDTLCRFWAFEKSDHRRRKILYHGRETPEEMFQTGFVAEIFGALGLGPQNFQKFDEAVILSNVIAPQPAIEELNHSYRAFGEFFNDLGERLCPSETYSLSDTPVYVTKMHMKKGISHFVNEEDFVNILARHGVEIFAPEQHSLKAQIEVFKSHSCVTGLVGSGLHTSVFAPQRGMLVLNYDKTLWTNQILIDQSNLAHSKFVYEECINEGGNNDFGNNFRISNPKLLAERFLKSIESYSTEPSARTPTSIKAEMKKFAVVLVVKNEAHDIQAWLAWYHALGFGTCIVFDDASDDGTGELVQQAANSQDIRIFAAKGPQNEGYEARQTSSYQFALENFREEFDWMAFFDADELLFLPQDENIQSFIRRFPGAQGVAVNWCNYGSSGHYLKPATEMFEAYTWHSNENRPINRHVKSIVRPKDVGSHWLGFHCFDVDPARYYLPNGRIVEWQEAPGISNAQPDWEFAKIMHYQCRSMEHFIERLKKRPDFQKIPNIWSGYDVHDAQDLRPTKLSQKVLSHMNSYQETANEVSQSRESALISAGKKATQSSISEWSFGASPEEDATRALNGVQDGSRKFHTSWEESPWWQVDLAGMATIRSIKIHNTTDHTADRFRNFTITVSIDGEVWMEIFRKNDDLIIGADGSGPFLWNGPGSAWGRFVRITLLDQSFLHLDQIEIFGNVTP